MSSIDSICLSVAHKLSDAEYIMATAAHPKNCIPSTQASFWHSPSLGYGYPGMITLFSEMDHYFPDQGWDVIAHQHASFLVQEIEHQGVPSGDLFAGLTGIVFALQLASKNGTRYQSLIAKLHTMLVQHVHTAYAAKILRPASAMIYDTMSGMTGILAYLLQNLNTEETVGSAKILVGQLVDITQPISVRGHIVPGWFNPQEGLPVDDVRNTYPHGCFDTGVAHGVSGYLLVLSQAYCAGVRVDGHRESIERIVAWLISTQQQVGAIPKVWPSRLGFDVETGGVELKTTFYRDGWCYGSPGIALALFRAGEALHNPSLQALALSTMEEACVRFQTERNLHCPSFCHGFSGLLCMAKYMYLKTGSEKLHTVLPDIIEAITMQYDETLPFGFRCFATVPGIDNDVQIDNAGLLDGAAGIIVSLIYAKLQKQRPWTSLFLMASSC